MANKQILLNDFIERLNKDPDRTAFLLLDNFNEIHNYQIKEPVFTKINLSTGKEIVGITWDTLGDTRSFGLKIYMPLEIRITYDKKTGATNNSYESVASTPNINYSKFNIISEEKLDEITIKSYLYSLISNEQSEEFLFMVLNDCDVADKIKYFQ